MQTTVGKRRMQVELIAKCLELGVFGTSELDSMIDVVLSMADEELIERYIEAGHLLEKYRAIKSYRCSN